MLFWELLWEQDACLVTTYLPWDPNNDQVVQKVKSALTTSRVCPWISGKASGDGRRKCEGEKDPAMQILVLTK